MVTVKLDGASGENALLKKHGLPATVVVSAKKAGNKFVVPAANPLSTALSAASANLSRSVNGTPSPFKVELTFTPNGKSVTMQEKITLK